jgi:hypothetical protein
MTVSDTIWLAEPQSFICANLLYVSWAPNIGIFITPVATMRVQGSTLTVARLPGASEMRLRASENGTQLVRWGK